MSPTLKWNREMLAGAWHARKAFMRARRNGLPGQAFYRFGRALGWRLWRAGHAEARQLLLYPVSITRYFEFDFAWRALAQDGFSPRRCLDVSSPFLFGFFVARQFPEIQIRMLNPDARDFRRTRRLADQLAWPGIVAEEVGMESLKAEAATYDAVWSISVIEHIAGTNGDDRDAVRRLWKVLRPGGRLILTVPTDKRAWDEYRDNDPYGTQPQSGAAGAYFFQRFYDEAAIQSRLGAAIGQEPARVEWFGEKVAGHFHAYIARWRREGARATIEDSLDIALNYQTYPSFADMPGAGVCGLLFVKP